MGSELQTDLESTRQKLEAEEFAGLTKQQVVGDLLYSTILSYFALNDMQDKISEKQATQCGLPCPQLWPLQDQPVPGLFLRHSP
ncbi:MAG: hypothetical protein ACFE0K_04560 [Alcanivorax sp.]|uniref:hypothetical protein n=1 Tax=Alcanivorax sp. TaxID=1872427 RepID=UPI003DA6DE8E